jgi:poly-beta-1,6-N-acetyl-D-glucosamine synthase
MLELIFWILFLTVAYAYLGYGLLLLLLTRWKRWQNRGQVIRATTEKKVTFIVCAYNENQWIGQKITNSLTQIYPKIGIRWVVVTDGSSDDTPEAARQTFSSAPDNPTWYVLHQPQRAGKIAAFHRAMEMYGIWPDCPPADHIIVSTDANTLLNPEAVERLVAHFTDPQVGAVAGEKRIQMGDKDAASSAGEGIYWRYESLLKQWDAELWTVVGAAGELFALRADLYEPVPHDTLVEDFFLTMRIAARGYRVAYEPNAYAVEASSANVREEMKRKVRIAAGGLQAVYRLAPLLNPFRHGVVTFQYVSHRVLRWVVAPVALPILLVLNYYLANQGHFLYELLLAAQFIFYCSAALGYFFQQRKIKIKAFFIPYYFCAMNLAMYAGAWRLWRGQQSVIWEKAKRADEQS